MKVKYSVTNISDRFLSIQGLSTFSIPGNCKDHIIELNPATAKKTIANLKGRFPYLEFKEVKEGATNAAQTVQTVANAAPKTEETKVEQAVVDEKANEADTKNAKKTTK